MEPSKEASTAPNVTFLHIRHSPEDAEEVWRMAKNADIILLENLGVTPRDQSGITQLVREVNEFPNSESKSSLIQKLKKKDNFGSRMVAYAIENRKEFFDIDSPLGGPGLSEKQEADDLFDKSVAQFEDNHFMAAYEIFKASTLQTAESIRIRDKNVTSQVEDLIDKHKDEWVGKSIVVIQGMMHTRTYHYFKHHNPGVNSSRKFPNANVYFPLVHEAISQTQRGRVDVAEHHIRRLFIYQFFILDALAPSVDLDKDELKINKFARELDQNTVDNIFNQFSNIEDFIAKSDAALGEIYALRHIKDIRDDLLAKYNNWVLSHKSPGRDFP